MDYDFDDMIDRRGTECAKWDRMQAVYGVSPEDGLSMWVADMDFRAAPVVRARLAEIVDHGIFGYTDCEDAYRQAIVWWMQARHDWAIDPEWIFTTTGLVNAIGLCLDVYTDPGDGIVTFTPVYHAFEKAVTRAGRQIVECPMRLEDGRYTLDLDAAEDRMTGRERMLIFCSPHNPVGRVWSAGELTAVAEFARRHDLILISDEIHHDLVYPGHRHLPMPLAAPQALDRTIMLTAPSKTFNLAGLHTGNVIIPDDALRARFADRLTALSLAPNSMGQFALTAAYSPEGAAWVDALIAYLDENRRVFDAGIAAIPGLHSIPLEGTYLAWVDFSGTGMSRQDFTERVEKGARIAANHGPTFGTGGDSFLRFNLGTQRARVHEAVARLADAFGDLQ
jgi:cystathionine beta-lyase